MTVICALSDGSGGVYIGSDRQWTANGDRPVITVKGKWAVYEDRALGIAGQGLTASVVLAEGLKILRDNETAPAVFHAVVEAAKLRGLKAVQKDDDQSPDYGSSMIFVSAGRVWDIDCCGAEFEQSGFWARGSGAEYALGAAHALEAYENTPQAIVAHAIRAAVRWNCGCGGEPWIEHIGGSHAPRP